MTLTNIDKDTNDRVNPNVGSHDVQINPMAHATSSISPRAQGTQSAGKVTTKDSKIVANDGTNNIGLFGFDDAGNMVVKVAKPGFDANNATDEELIFNSAQDVFKIVQTGNSTSPSVAVNTGGANYATFVGTTVVIPHGLSFIPVPIGVFDNGGLYIPLPFTDIWQNSSSGYTQFTIDVSADATNVYISAKAFAYNTTASVSALPVKYYLLQQTAN